MLLTDESRFCLDFTDRSQLVWGMPKERFDELNVAEHGHYGKGTVMVWKGINVNRKTDLYAIENGILTALRYCNATLDQFVKSYAGSIGQEFILMDDNARPHVTNAYLEHETNNKGADQPANVCSLITAFFYLLNGKYNILTCFTHNFNILVSLCSCAEWSESYSVANPRDRFPIWY